MARVHVSAAAVGANCLNAALMRLLLNCSRTLSMSVTVFARLASANHRPAYCMRCKVGVTQLLSLASYKHSPTAL